MPTDNAKSRNTHTSAANAGQPAPSSVSSRECFIPLRKAELREAILADPVFTPRQRELFGQLCRRIEAIIHYGFHDRLETLKDCYSPFDPDFDCASRQHVDDHQRNKKARLFIETFKGLLEKANFRHLSQQDLSDSLDQASRLGFNMEVDFGIFERLEIYSRGEGSITKPLPGLWNRWRKRTMIMPVFQRLILLFRLKPEFRDLLPSRRDNILIKIFKDIPRSDVDMLLPGTRVRMTWLDQGKIILPTLSGVAFTVYKILMGALKIAFAGVYGLIAVLGVLGGTLGYASRSFYNYINTRDKYQLNLARNLYYQNLDSNAGVIYRLLDEAEEQEFREAIIAYYLLWKNALGEGWAIAQLDAAAEAHVREWTGLEVDFEIADALEKLTAMKLVQPAAAGRWRAVELEPAVAHLNSLIEQVFESRSDNADRLRLSLPHFFQPRSPDTQDDRDLKS